MVEPVARRLPKKPVPEAVKAVEDAYGKCEAVDVVAVKYALTISPTTESLAYGEVVPRPKLLSVVLTVN